MQIRVPTRRDSAAVSATFVDEREAAKLTEMLAIATEDLDRVGGGAAALTQSMACCCCHHLA
jgi:hypothetical protein